MVQSFDSFVQSFSGESLLGFVIPQVVSTPRAQILSENIVASVACEVLKQTSHIDLDLHFEILTSLIQLDLFCKTRG